MPTLTIRNVDPEARDQIRVHAARHGRLMEAEVRDILNTFARQHKCSPKQLAKQIQKRFKRITASDEIEMPKRQQASNPIVFDE